MTVIGRGSLADAWLSDMHSPVESVVASRPPVGELCENATPLASIRASAMVANNSSVRLISTLPSFGGRRVGLPFRPELYNATTVASIGGRRIAQMSDLLGNRCYADFRE